jgi:CRP-like cAMP-binding protein
MSPGDIESLSPFLTESALSGGQVLVTPGDKVENIYFPSSAVISIVTPMLDGRSVESGTIGFESVVGLISGLSGEPSPNRVFAQIGGGAIRLPVARLRERCFASQSLMKLALSHIDATACQEQQSVACNALHDASARLARWLLMTQDRVDGSLLPLTQEYLAIMLGVQRTTVTATAVSLKKAGLINYQRGAITIADRAGLERHACECYAIGHTRFGKLLHRDKRFEASAG